jgi:hypothetical protein
MLKKTINSKLDSFFEDIIQQLKTLVQEELESRQRMNIELQFEEFIMNKLDELVIF